MTLLRFRSPKAGRRAGNVGTKPVRYGDAATYHRQQREAVAALVTVTYELLDAHADTTRLAADHVNDLEWQKHLGYLRDLQRIGREVLAQAASAAAPAER
jgi:hypothetical protein